MTLLSNSIVNIRRFVRQCYNGEYSTPPGPGKTIFTWAFMNSDGKNNKSNEMLELCDTAYFDLLDKINTNLAVSGILVSAEKANTHILHIDYTNYKGI